MEIIIDSDVKAVVEFMQSRFAATKLVGIAKGVADMAPLLWGLYESEGVQAITLGCDIPTGDHDEHTKSCASVSVLG
jgi:hypothetical protein